MDYQNTGLRDMCYQNTGLRDMCYLLWISIHETLISRSICLLWAKITSDTHISIRNPPSATDNRAPNPPSAGWVADAAVCVAGDLGPEEAYAS